jgi:sodium-dependent dicarboxylate transporter 2/3/5
MERWGLHRRIALVVLRFTGDQPTYMVGGFMLVSAVLSMWVSNTATVIMMLPVAVSVFDLVARRVQPSGAGADLSDSTSAIRNFGLCLMLGIAYGASIGGIGTPIGTPPNLFLVSFAKENLGREISFVRWMAVALPLVAVFLPLTWLFLTRVIYRIRLRRIPGGSDFILDALAELGPPSRGERITLAVFLMAALLWVTRPLLTGLELAGTHPLAGLSDAGIAMLAAIALFVTPVERRSGRFALDWDTAVKLPWGILILFGGGLSLASAIQRNGVGELLGSQVAGFAGVPSLFVVLGVVTLIVFLTELTSNTATTATLIPILAALAPGLGMEPLLLAVPATLAASCAFMLPVATPPNAIVFGSGLIRVSEMSRAGFWLNWIGIFLVTAASYAVVMPLLAPA